MSNYLQKNDYAQYRTGMENMYNHFSNVENPYQAAKDSIEQGKQAVAAVSKVQSFLNIFKKE